MGVAKTANDKLHALHYARACERYFGLSFIKLQQELNWWSINKMNKKFKRAPAERLRSLRTAHRAAMLGVDRAIEDLLE